MAHRRRQRPLLLQSIVLLSLCCLCAAEVPSGSESAGPASIDQWSTAEVRFAFVSVGAFRLLTRSSTERKVVAWLSSVARLTAEQKELIAASGVDGPRLLALTPAQLKYDYGLALRPRKARE